MTQSDIALRQGATDQLDTGGAWLLPWEPDEFGFPVDGALVRVINSQCLLTQKHDTLTESSLIQPILNLPSLSSLLGWRCGAHVRIQHSGCS